MPILQTKPRTGSRPMLYFKGTLNGLKRILPETLQRRLKKIGLEFYNLDHSATETYTAIETAISLASRLKNGESIFSDIRLKEGVIPIRIVKTKTGRLLIHQMPQLHGITKETPFKDLIQMLSNGFMGRDSPNTVIDQRRKRNSDWAIPEKAGGITGGDEYSLEIAAPIRSFSEHEARFDSANTNRVHYDGSYYIGKAATNQIVSINILLDKKSDANTRKEKKEFYQREIQRRFGIPVKFN